MIRPNASSEARDIRVAKSRFLQRKQQRSQYINNNLGSVPPLFPSSDKRAGQLHRAADERIQPVDFPVSAVMAVGILEGLRLKESSKDLTPELLIYLNSLPSNPPECFLLRAYL